MNTLCKIITLVVLASAFGLGKARSEEIYLVRGGFEIFSVGMDSMAQQLRAKGYKAQSHSIVGWKGIASDIIKRSKTKSVSYPIIFLGHSLGADVANEFAAYLGENGVTADLVIGFDATSQKTFTRGAKRVVNFRTTGGGHYVKGAGFKGSIKEVDVTHLGVNHMTIEQDAAVQKLALAEVMKLLPRRR
jgi:thioesterase domain-containing protein